jgi:ABC-2 type transport system ATP-binding protein
MSGAPVVEVDRVSKFFGGVVAVSDVTFQLRPGITAVLGPNGAGKSTLLRMVCGLTAPSKGTVRLLGSDPRSDMEVRRSVGLVPQQEQLYSRLTAREFVELACILHGVANVQRRTRDALDVVQMDLADTRPLGTYSKGMRQRVKIAAAIVNEPAVLVADEPLSGLDPNQRAEVINLFHTLAGLGRSLVVSSHVLDEVEQFGSRVLVLAQGRLAAEGDFHAIRALMDDRPHRIRVASDDPRQLARLLLADPAVSSVQLTGERVELETSDIPAFRSGLARTARDHGIRLREVMPLDDDLESVFRYLVADA